MRVCSLPGQQGAWGLRAGLACRACLFFAAGSKGSLCACSPQKLAQGEYWLQLDADKLWLY